MNNKNTQYEWGWDEIGDEVWFREHANRVEFLFRDQENSTWPIRTRVNTGEFDEILVTEYASDRGNVVAFSVVGPNKKKTKYELERLVEGYWNVDEWPSGPRTHGRPRTALEPPTRYIRIRTASEARDGSRGAQEDPSRSSSSSGLSISDIGRSGASGLGWGGVG